MELDVQMAVILLVSAASSYLIILFCRKLIEGIDRATDRALSKNKILRGIGIVLDGLLPWLPCIPSGLLSMILMSYCPPDSIWNSQLLYFLVGALAGVVSQTAYYSITRAIRKQADRVAASKVPNPPSDPSPGS